MFSGDWMSSLFLPSILDRDRYGYASGSSIRTLFRFVYDRSSYTGLMICRMFGGVSISGLFYWRNRPVPRNRLDSIRAPRLCRRNFCKIRLTFPESVLYFHQKGELTR